MLDLTERPRIFVDGLIPISSIGWIDFETFSTTSIDAGTTRYMVDAQALLLPYALMNGPLQVVAVRSVERARAGEPIDWSDMPDEFRRFHDRVIAGEAVWAAFNAGFDRQAWNLATTGFPDLEPHQVIDVAVQTGASGMPPSLEGAGQRLFKMGKQPDGKALIRLFCYPEATATEVSHPREWQSFIDYSIRDVGLMRDCYGATRPLPIDEWRQYWAGEAINERGVCVDVPFCQAASAAAKVAMAVDAENLKTLTAGFVTAVTQVERMKTWLMDKLPPDGIEIMTRVAEKRDEDGELTREAKFGLDRARLQQLIVYLTAQMDTNEWSQDQEDALELLSIRDGMTTTVAKFDRMVEAQLGGVLRGQYVFAGAPQTGRFSSRGVQVHNLKRDALAAEPELIEALLAGSDQATLAAIGDARMPVSRKLAHLIRPALVAPPGKVLVWSDWSQIEARVLPWLDGSNEAEARLDIFRAVDADPSQPDLYTRSTADMMHVTVEEVTKALRQRGKVAELALGFNGGVGALMAMGAGYGLHLEPAEAKEIVDRWRAVNRWAVRFWGRHNAEESYGIWGAVQEARMRPGSIISIGRLNYMFEPTYLGGTLFCELPSGRILTYAKLRLERVPVEDDEGKVVDYRNELRYQRQFGRAKMWPGSLVENAVQATAADFLRGTLVRLEADPALAWMPVVLHTHDEIVVEVDERRAEAAAAILAREMQRGFPWSDGLPLMSDETIAYHYTKHEASTFLRSKP